MSDLIFRTKELIYNYNKLIDHYSKNNKTLQSLGGLPEEFIEMFKDWLVTYPSLENIELLLKCSNLVLRLYDNLCKFYEITDENKDISIWLPVTFPNTLKEWIDSESKRLKLK